MRMCSISPSVRKFYRSLFISALMALTLQCCGNGVTRGDAGRLQVTLKVPDGENPEFFWLGVQARKLQWLPRGGDPREMEWKAGSAADWDTREGDRIAFQGIDDKGRVVVDGAAEVQEEKIVTIPLRRVL